MAERKKKLITRINQRGPQKQRYTQQELGSIEENRENQQLRLSATTTKYECTDCSATFDTTASHRKHYQAFHGRIKVPKVIERAEI